MICGHEEQNRFSHMNLGVFISLYNIKYLVIGLEYFLFSIYWE